MYIAPVTACAIVLNIPVVINLVQVGQNGEIIYCEQAVSPKFEMARDNKTLDRVRQSPSSKRGKGALLANPAPYHHRPSSTMRSPCTVISSNRHRPVEDPKRAHRSRPACIAATVTCTRCVITGFERPPKGPSFPDTVSPRGIMAQAP